MLHFVYRNHASGPLSRRVVSLDAPSVLEWFRSALAEARVADDPAKLVIEKLGGPVYGFSSLFEAAKRLALPPPVDTDDLRRMLHAHLYVEGGSEAIRLDDHSLRVLTDNDEVQLAYFFFDEELAQAKVERSAWLLTEDPDLPDGAGEGKFKRPVEVTTLEVSGEPDKAGGTTYACLFTFRDSMSIPGRAYAWQAVRVPELAAHLRATTPASDWPAEAIVLRAMVEAGDTSIGPALERASRFPIDPVANTWPRPPVAWAGAREQVLAMTGGQTTHAAHPERSIVHAHEHVAVGCMHVSDSFGFQQWVIFDDLWAARHAALAGSILRYASFWDPFVTSKAATKVSKIQTEATALEQRWGRSIRVGAPILPYAAQRTLAKGEVIEHVKFGRGAVLGIDGGKARVLFRDGVKTLLHAS